MGGGSPKKRMWYSQVCAMSAGDDDVVRIAAGIKGGEAEVAHLHGVVDELLVIGGEVRAESVRVGLLPRQRRGHAPAPLCFVLVWLYVDLVRLPCLVLLFVEDSCAFEIAVLGVE